MKNLTLILLLSAFAFISPAKGQTEDQDTTALHFIVQASIANLQEISAGKLATQKAVRPDVKTFGQRMVADHGKAQASLLQLAQSKGYRIPSQATSPPVPEPMLAKATGKDFDRLYVHMMAPGHRQTVMLFQKYSISGKDPALKAFAQQTLPVLKEHLAAITAIDNTIKDAAQ